MIMKKRMGFIVIFIIIFVQSVFANPVTVYAESLKSSREGNLGDFANFTPIRDYSEGTFIDINALWAERKIKTAYEYGIINGVGSNRYEPSGFLKVMDALTIAAKIHAIYLYGDESDNVIATYKIQKDNGALAYCKSHNLIQDEFDGKLNAFITRAEMAHAWSRLLMDSDMQSQNIVLGLPDVTESTRYSDDIFRLYEVGILAGINESGAFAPDEKITRAECAAIFLNLIQKDKRLEGRTYKMNYFDATPINDLTGFNGFKTVINQKGVAVSVNNSGAIAVCQKLSDAKWEFVVNEKDISLYDIAVIGDEFIAIGDYDQTSSQSVVLRSVDGVYWMEKTIDRYRLFEIFTVNDIFFLTGRNPRNDYCLFKTSDFESFEQIAFSDDELVERFAPELLAEDNMMKSNAFFWPERITYFNGRYVVSGYVPHSPWEVEGLILTSIDLEKWEVGVNSSLSMPNLIQMGETLIVYGSNAESAYLGDLGMLGGGAGTVYPTSMYYTTDGLVFNQCSITFPTGAGGFSYITSSEDTFFGVGYKILGISADGENWITNDMPVNWGFAGYADGKYCAIGEKADGTGQVIMAQSLDGSSWITKEYSGAYTQLGVDGIALQHEGYFLSSRGLAVSKDLVTWESNFCTNYEPFIDSIYDGKQFVVITEQRVLVSEEGEDWNVMKDFGSKKDFFFRASHLKSIEYTNGNYIIYGLYWGNGWELYAWLSNDLVNWEERKVNVTGYENTNSSLNGAVVTVYEDKALLVYANPASSEIIIASSSDFTNFNRIKNVEQNKEVWFNKPVCIDGQWLFTANDIYSDTAKDMLYISIDLENFERIELPVKSVTNIIKYMDSYAIVSNNIEIVDNLNTESFKVSLTRDFKTFSNYTFPVTILDPNIYNGGNGYDMRNNNWGFIIGDTFFVLGEKVSYTKDFNKWYFVQGIPPNNYLTTSTNGKITIIGGVGIMAIIR